MHAHLHYLSLLLFIYLFILNNDYFKVYEDILYPSRAMWAAGY